MGLGFQICNCSKSCIRRWSDVAHALNPVQFWL